MTPDDVLSDCLETVAVLVQNECVLDSRQPFKKKSGPSTIVTSVSSVSLSETFGIESPIEEYLWYLDNGFFLVVTDEASLIQISYTFDPSNILSKHRLAWIPCPLYFEPPEYSETTLGDLIRNASDKDLRERARPAGGFRFDFDVAAATQTHPESHFTLFRKHCRIPVTYPLSVGHFIHFVASHLEPGIIPTEKRTDKHLPKRRALSNRSQSVDGRVAGDIFLDVMR